jgi:A-kinase anchor protein 1
MATAVMTAIVSPAHFFIQMPETSTFQHFSRLENCMSHVYGKMQDRAPKVPSKSIEVGLVCVTKQNDKYYRIQIVSYDISTDCCEVKFLDYGGTEKIDTSEMLQIRQDFLNLPFQAVECYLSNVIPPPSETEWPFESIVYLEEITRGKTLSAREIGVAEDSIPIVQLYITYTDESGQLETRFVNKELVDKGAAQWVEHSSVQNMTADSV